MAPWGAKCWYRSSSLASTSIHVQGHSEEKFFTATAVLKVTGKDICWKWLIAYPVILVHRHPDREEEQFTSVASGTEPVGRGGGTRLEELMIAGAGARFEGAAVHWGPGCGAAVAAAAAAGWPLQEHGWCCGCGLPFAGAGKGGSAGLCAHNK
eukprot:1143859-Pelagomonas_calceolata.AAC.8